MKVKPLNQRLLIFITLVNEMIAGFAITSALVIGIYDNMSGDYIAQKMFAGWLIIFSNLILLFSLIFFTFIKFVCKIAEAMITNKNVIKAKLRQIFTLIKILKKKVPKINAVAPL